MDESTSPTFKYRRILVPLDGSELAEMAMTPAVEMARHMGSEIHCLQVVTGLTLNLDPTLNQRIINAREQMATLYLRSLSGRFSNHNFDIKTATTSGKAAVSIIDYATEHDIDLIVMSSHGQSALRRWVYGNVAIKILRRAPCDTLMVRPLANKVSSPQKRVMVPLDGSPLSERAMGPALALASAWNLEILLLRVLPPIDTDQDPMTSHDLFNDMEEKINEEAMAYLLDIKADQTIDSLSINAEIATGPPAATIVDTATTNEVDLIVMSSHGSGGVGLWLMGSVSEKVLRKAPCSTLIVRNDE
jgi:nucleotide-binding universal stress UspA family protein